MIHIAIQSRYEPTVEWMGVELATIYTGVINNTNTSRALVNV